MAVCSIGQRAFTAALIALAMSQAAAVTARAQAPATSFRIEIATDTFTPLQSACAGAVGDDVVFFSGLAGMGLHAIFAPAGVFGFPAPAYNRMIYVYDEAANALHAGSISHLSPQLREALTVTNAPFIQDASTLYIYGGYGPLNDNSDWFTRATVLAIDLPPVIAAIKAGQNAPASAFTLTPAPDAQVAGGAIVRMGSQWALIGGSKFTGDYLGSTATPFTNEYTIKHFIFDPLFSVSTPLFSYFDAAARTLHRRDMNAMPATLPSATGVKPGYVIAGGVFDAIFPWENPVSYSPSDPFPIRDATVFQRMNQYDAPHVSFYSATADENRFVIFSGLSLYEYNGAGGYTFNFNTPWTTEITQIQMVGGAFLTTPDANDPQTMVIDQVIGVMPLPVTNTELILNRRVPTNQSGQVSLDLMPANEVLLGRIYGGLKAATPGASPPTFASSQIINVYVTVGVRGDINRDGTVNVSDLATLIGSWSLSDTTVDLNLDGVVDVFDLATLLGFWGNQTPG